MGSGVADFDNSHGIAYNFPHCDIPGFTLVQVTMMIFAFLAYQFAVMMSFGLNRAFQFQFAFQQGKGFKDGIWKPISLLSSFSTEIHFPGRGLAIINVHVLNMTKTVIMSRIA